MNGYIAFYKGRQIEVRAFTTHDAQMQAQRVFNNKHGRDITVMLAEKDGKEVIHGTEEL